MHTYFFMKYNYLLKYLTDDNTRNIAYFTILMDLINNNIRQNLEFNAFTKRYNENILDTEPYYIEDRNSEAFKNALDFWTEHALIYDKESSVGDVFTSTWNNELTKAFNK